ncbi:MAG: DUF2264 domain-containing protein [Pedobacter sp.]|uniref:DUF2264 domain-containing protein n=1 Tax=Pedobacter sp. TaxID=1411316 RepID=UPI003565BA3C
MNRIIAIIIFSFPFYAYSQNVSEDGKMQRDYYVQTLVRIAHPVLDALSKNELKKRMPLEAKYPDTRKDFMHLEAFGRLLAGMAPWLELGIDDTEEGKLRKKYIELSVICIRNATDPKAPDFMNFNVGKQPLVDAAFLAQALLRAPNQLWGNLDSKTKNNVLNALKSSRVISPGYNNWLLFSAIIEAALQKYDNSGDKMRMDYAVRQMLLWYKGDGAYGDGPDFHWDYYNSFVIQPMFLEILQVLKANGLDPENNYDLALDRASRYAAVQERLISPEGTYPLLGRSITYRFGAFQLLSKIALMKALPPKLTPQQVRFALYTVIKKQIEAPGTFDDQGWLRIGFYGSQPELAENYICTGSLYLCSQAFLVLGLPASDAFWTDENVDWTSRMVYKGKSAFIDKSIKK